MADLFNNPNAKYVLAAPNGCGKRTILTDIDRFGNDRDAAEKEMKRLADESIHGNIGMYLALGIKDGNFDGDWDFVMLYPTPENRSVFTFVVERINGDNKECLSQHKTVDEAKAEAQRIKEEDRANGIGGAISVIRWEVRNGKLGGMPALCGHYE